MPTQLSELELEELMPTFVSVADRDQEIELLKLLGVQFPNKRLVKLRMLSRYPDLHFGDVDRLESAAGLQDPFGLPEPNPEAVRRLTELADEYDELAEPIYDFLYDPSDENFKICLRAAKRLGLIKTSRLPDPPVKRTLIVMVVEYLRKHGPTPRETLITEVGFYHSSRRPAAAVRTTLRRLLSLEMIQLNGNIYTLTGLKDIPGDV